jgi:hypothetical protein
MLVAQVSYTSPDYSKHTGMLDAGFVPSLWLCRNEQMFRLIQLVKEQKHLHRRVVAQVAE